MTDVDYVRFLEQKAGVLQRALERVRHELAWMQQEFYAPHHENTRLRRENERLKYKLGSLEEHLKDVCVERDQFEKWWHQCCDRRERERKKNG